MRDYTKQPIQSVPQPEARQVLSVIDYYLQDLSKGMARIQKGQVPDGSGDLIINQVISDLYWYKPGKSSFGTAYMDVAASGGGIISSTRHSTKGNIYFGVAGSAVFDEANVLWGIGTASPTARVHLAVPASLAQAPAATGDVSIASWANSNASGTATLYAYVTGSADGNHILHPDSSSTTYTMGFLSATNPGVTAGHTLTIRALATVAAGTKRLTMTLDSGGSSWWASSVSTADASLGTATTYATTTYTIPASSIPSINYSNIRFGVAPAGNNSGGYYQIDYVALSIPAVGGGGSQVKLLRMTDTTQTIDADFLSDGGSSEALTFRPSAVGAGKLAIGSALPLLFATAGSTGDVWQRADTLGQGQWASASALATRFYATWRANGPYRVDTDVDGAFVTPRACTLNRVLLYRRKAGTSGGTHVSLLSGGSSALSAPMAVSASAGASATASAAISSATIAVSSRITINTISAEAGVPQDYDVWAEFY